MPPVRINLPNGESSISTIIGSVRVSEHIILQHALFIPNFKFNIIVVQKLASDSKLLFVLDEDSSLI
jgi:small basic protein